MGEVMQIKSLIMVTLGNSWITASLWQTFFAVYLEGMRLRPEPPSTTPSHIEAGDAFAYAPISQLIGLQVEPGPVGEAVVRLPVSQKMHNPMGAVHGGVIALLADAAMVSHSAGR